MNTYTAFCRQQDGKAPNMTIHVVDAENIEEAKLIAAAVCASDWCWNWSEIDVVGIAEGEVNILFWDEEGDE